MGLVNQLDGTLRAPRLSDTLFEKRGQTFATIAALASNVEGVENSLRLAAGHVRFLVLVGPSGWGKSHLLSAIECRIRQEGAPCPAAIPAEKFVETQPTPNPLTPLLLDDCQEVLFKSRPKAMLRVALEHRIRSARPTVLSFTGAKVTRQIRSFVPNPREWVLCTIAAPEPAERVVLINHMAKGEGLVLSPSLVRIMARELHGNGRTLAGALKRLRLSSSQWTEGESTLRACGLLEPFFADNSSWDLKHKIMKAAETSRSMFSRVSSQDLAVYVMLRVATLSEADVARVVGVEPAAAYLRSGRFEREILREPAVAAITRQFIDLVVSQLTQD